MTRQERKEIYGENGEITFKNGEKVLKVLKENGFEVYGFGDKDGEVNVIEYIPGTFMGEPEFVYFDIMCTVEGIASDIELSLLSDYENNDYTDIDNKILAKIKDGITYEHKALADFLPLEDRIKEMENIRDNIIKIKNFFETIED